MNRSLLLTTIIRLIGITANAQNLSIGARTGLGRTFDIDNTKAGALDKTWDKELFIRHETKGRLAFEVNLIQYNTTHHTDPRVFEIGYGEYGPRE